MKDGLYLNNVWVCELDCNLTFQGNDLTKPDALTASFSDTFTLPDTTAVRKLTQNAEQVDSGGRDPYRQLPAKLISEGEVIFWGVAEFNVFQAGWSVNLLDSLVPFFDSLKDKTIQDLDLSRYDHPWTLEVISTKAGAVDGTVYPAIDYGGIKGNIFPYDTICPGIYVKTLLQQIALESGYSLAGDWLTDEWLKRASLPFVGSDPLAHDEDWKNDRYARVTTTGNGNQIMLKNGSPIDIQLPLNVDNLPLDGYLDGKLNCYKAERATYVCPEAMRIAVQASVSFISQTRYGAAEIRLIVARNGVNAAEEYWSEAGYYDALDIPTSLSLDTNIDCRAGDELTIRLTGSSRTDFSSYEFFFSQTPGEMWASFTPDTTIRLGDMWKTAINLPPDITCQTLFLTVAKIMCGTFDIDTGKRSVTLNTLDRIVSRTAIAKDWSRKVEESQEPELNVKFEGYGKRNLLKWKEADEKENVGFGDGELTCDVQNLPPEATLFELPFAACIASDNSLNGYGNPVLIKTRTIRGSGENQTIEKNNATPRIVLMEPSKTVEVTTVRLTPEGTLRNESVTLTGCWWGIRPIGLKNSENAFCNSFTPLLGGGEQTLTDRYFNGLKRILRRPRMLTVSMYFRPSDIAELDLFTPVRIKNVRAGSLDINNNCFYINKIGPYRSGATCQAVLIAIE